LLESQVLRYGQGRNQPFLKASGGQKGDPSGLEVMIALARHVFSGHGNLSFPDLVETRCHPQKHVLAATG
jgi:hypothetical protein